MNLSNSKYQALGRNVAKLKAGQAYLAEAGVDFTCTPQSFAGVVYQLANAKGGDWKGTATVFGRYVVYAFYRGSDFMRPNLSAYPVVQRMRGES
jgi:hypothetical protein